MHKKKKIRILRGKIIQTIAEGCLNLAIAITIKNTNIDIITLTNIDMIVINGNPSLWGRKAANPS